jgi:hypothetical protein
VSPSEVHTQPRILRLLPPPSAAEKPPSIELNQRRPSPSSPRLLPARIRYSSPMRSSEWYPTLQTTATQARLHPSPLLSVASRSNRPSWGRRRELGSILRTLTSDSWILNGSYCLVRLVRHLCHVLSSRLRKSFSRLSIPGCPHNAAAETLNLLAAASRKHNLWQGVRSLDWSPGGTLFQAFTHSCLLPSPILILNLVNTTSDTTRPDPTRLLESRSLATNIYGFPIGVMAGILPMINDPTVYVAHGGDFVSSCKSRRWMPLASASSSATQK